MSFSGNSIIIISVLGCNEVVTWVVFERALPVAQVQVRNKCTAINFYLLITY